MCTRVDTCINKHFSFKIFLLNPPPLEKILDPRLQQISVFKNRSSGGWGGGGNNCNLNSGHCYEKKIKLERGMLEIIVELINTEMK